VDLFQAASDNAAALERRYRAERSAAAPAEAAVWDHFVGRVERDGRLGLNLRQTILVRFLAVGGGYQNIYEQAEELERRTGEPRDVLLRARLKNYYDLRTAFDGALAHGTRFRYGALNLGGLGAVRFGDYCLVFQASYAAGLAALAYLWADSLKTYILPDGTVDLAGLRRDACPHSHRQFLAGLKHGAEVERTLEADWPTLVCSSAGFIEAVFLGTPVPEDCEAVRMELFDNELYTSSTLSHCLPCRAAIRR
jgi:hypothetical protein